MTPEIESTVFKMLRSVENGPLTKTKFNRKNCNFQPRERYSVARVYMDGRGLIKEELGFSANARAHTNVTITDAGVKELARIRENYGL